MRFTIDTDILSKNNLTLGEFLVMLMGFSNISYEKCYDSLVQKGIAKPCLFGKSMVILSDKEKKLIEKILTESDDKMIDCGIDFEDIALKLQHHYPSGIKAGTTYSWRDTTEEIAQKLRALVAIHGFTFTEQEAIDAVTEYVSAFNDYKYMSLLKYFILKTYEDEQGNKDIDSMFMTIIENHRKK